MSDVIEYKCPNCGGPLEFDPNSQKVVCPNCSTSFDAEAIESFNEELSAVSEDEVIWKKSSKEYSDEELSSMEVYHCDSCGAEIVADKNVSATSCPFCDSPIILKGRLSGALKPDVVIPFRYDKASTKEQMNKYLKSKLFLPNVFRDENKIENVKGIYEPFWVFDADVSGKVFLRGEKEFSYMRGDYKITETSHFRIIVDGEAGFDHIPVDASTTMPDELMESIEPFDYEGAKDFSPVYLSGYFSNRYDVDSETCQERAKKRLYNGTSEKFMETIHGYLGLRVESSALKLDNPEEKYALYPVWILNTGWRDKKYTFSMNAQTGKIVGNVPCSPWKYLLWFIIFYVPTALLIALVVSLWLGDMEISGESFGLGVVFGLIFGWIPSALFCHHHRKALKPVELQRSAKNYYRQGSLNIHRRRDIFLYKTVRRVKVRDSSNNNHPNGGRRH